MLSRERIRRWWPFALLTGAALLLSQSKFSLVSALLAGLYIFMVYERRRTLLLVLAVLCVPVAGYLLLRLPTFANTLAEGLSAEAFVERFENLLLLVNIIEQHLFLGIGPGQYGVFRGATLYGNPNYSPGYTPNMDFLKVFAELGVLGFITMLALLGSLVLRFARTYRVVPLTDRPRYLALLLGGVAILLNMLIGYELLHSFFWINIGALLYLTERAARGPSAVGRTEPGTA
jgi:putative inorganic carbon (hco3(-)) transporter